MTGPGCTACSHQVVNSIHILQCSACDTSLGLSLTPMMDPMLGINVNKCIPAVNCTDPGTYYNGSSCVACTPDCANCHLDTCAFCQEGFVMKTLPDGSRTCVDHMIGCGLGLFINDQMECKPCHESCINCISAGPQHCIE